MGEFCGARPDQASIHKCERAKLLSLCEINSFCLVQIILMVSCDSKINPHTKSSMTKSINLLPGVSYWSQNRLSKMKASFDFKRSGPQNING